MEKSKQEAMSELDPGLYCDHHTASTKLHHSMQVFRSIQTSKVEKYRRDHLKAEANAAVREMAGRYHCRYFSHPAKPKNLERKIP